MQIRAELSQVNDKERTVEVTWSTGEKGLRASTSIGPFYEELSMKPNHIDMSRLQAGTAPVLAVHDRNSLSGVIGVVEKAWLDNGQGKAILRFSEADPNADMAFRKIQERILRNVSVGYKVFNYDDISERCDEIPTLLATKWQPQEISIVPIGFDMNATTRSEDLTQNEVEIVSARNDDPVKEISAMTEQEIEAKRLADIAAEALKTQQVEQNRAAVEEEKTRAVEAEKNRCIEIRAAVKAAQLEDTMSEELINRNLSTADASKEIFKKMEEKNKQTAVQSAAVTSVEITRDENETKREGLENFLLHRVDSKKHTLSENGRQYYGMHSVRMAEQLIGRKLGETDQQLVTRAMTTSDLPNILANVAEKSMRADYQAQQATHKVWSKPGTLRNYKQANRLMLGDFPQLEEVNEHGEFKQGSMSESKEPIQLKRYGKSIVFTKEMIINDDLSALSDFSSKSARAAVRLEAGLVYGILSANAAMSDGVLLFHADHGNVGSATDITVDAVGAGFAAIRNQLSLDGDYLDIAPKYLMVGTAKETKARQFVSQNMLATSNSSINPYGSMLQVVVDPRISGNIWYLAADSALIDTVECATLESEQGPVITTENKQNGNVKISCEHSVGASALDYRGLYKNPGA